MIKEGSTEYGFAKLAVDKAKLCETGGSKTNPLPKVAAVAVRGEELLGWYAKGAGGQVFRDGETIGYPAVKGAHAEQGLFEILGGVDFGQVSLYVTLEPCVQRPKDIPSCADLIVQRGIQSVVIGNQDPNPAVGGLAWKTFIEAGVKVRDFPEALRKEAEEDNQPFFDKFKASRANEGGAQFDYNSNGGLRVLGETGREFETRWTNKGNGSIYALDTKYNVAVAKHCREFEHIDDPGRWFEDSNYTKPVLEGQIVVFRNQLGYALVKVEHVRIATTEANAVLKYQYQLRYTE